MRQLAAVLVCSLAGLAALAAQAEESQVLQDQFEACRGEGKGFDRGAALEDAKAKALQAKINEIFRKQNLKGIEETHLGWDDILRNMALYVGRVEVRSEKIESTEVTDEKGKRKLPLYKIDLTANVNVTRLKKDFEKARRIAALRQFGEQIAAVLEERLRPQGDKDDARAEPVHDDLAAVGAERLLMSYKFKPVPLAKVRPYFHEEVKKGRTLKEETFKNEIVESLASAGAHVRIVGVVVIEKGEAEKDPKGGDLLVFDAGWWAELHIGDSYHRKLGAVSEVKKGCSGRGKTEEEAAEDAFKAAGEALALDLAVRLAASLDDATPTESWELMVVFNGVEPFQLRPLEAALNKLEGVTGARKMRFGNGCYVVMVAAQGKREDVEEALVAAAAAAGFALEETREELVKFRKN